MSAVAMLRRSALLSRSTIFGARRNYIEIKVTEGEKEIVVEGVAVPIKPNAPVIDPDRIPVANKQDASIPRLATGPCGSANCHPLCKLPFVHNVKHTGEI